MDTGETVKKVCVRFSEESISGAELIRRAGVDPVFRSYSGKGVAVCALCGTGCPGDESCLTCDPEGRFWAYSRAPAGTTTLRTSPEGASSTEVRDGDVDGWRWSRGLAPAYASVAEVCDGAPAGAATATTTAPAPAPAPAPAAPPAGEPPGNASTTPRSGSGSSAARPGSKPPSSPAPAPPGAPGTPAAPSAGSSPPAGPAPASPPTPAPASATSVPTGVAAGPGAGDGRAGQGGSSPAGLAAAGAAVAGLVVWGAAARRRRRPAAKP